MTNTHLSFFLNWKEYNRELRLVSWNVGGLRDKLDEPDILKFVFGYDLVWLLETKKYFHLNVPGFSVYANVSRSGQHRGGIVMLVKRWLTEYVSRIDTEAEGQIWIQLSWWPHLKLGGV